MYVGAGLEIDLGIVIVTLHHDGDNDNQHHLTMDDYGHMEMRG